MRKLKLVLILVMLISAQNIFAQTGWVQQNPEPVGTNYLRMTFVNDITGWICGSYGTIFKTTNSGINWVLQYTNSNEVFYSISFLNERIGWAVGTGGKVLRTTNGGENWQLIESITTRNLYDVKFTDSLTGIACGARYIILRTTNGGVNWTLRYIGNYDDDAINYIKFFNSNKGFVTGDDANLVTTDAGFTWNVVSYNFADVRNSFYLDSSNGWRVTGQQIYKTTNLGVNWTQIFSGAGIYYSIFFINENTGFNTVSAIGEARVNKTTDGGTTWVVTSSTANLAYNFVYFVNSSIGFVGKNDGTILRTTDTGNSWQPITLTASLTLANLRSINFRNENTGWAIGDNGTILKTTNGGINWSVGRYATNSELTGYQIASVSDDTLYLATRYQDSPQYWGGKILKSIDGGASWFQSLSGLYTPYFPFSFVNSLTGWLCASNGLMATTNGGLNWANRTTMGYYYLLNDVQFLNPSTGFVLADTHYSKPRLLITKNGGSSWSSVTLPQLFYYINFLNESTGFIYGYSNKLMKTTNGGINWDYCHPEIPVTGIEFIDNFTGFCITSSGNIWKTTNTGEYWDLSTSYVNNSLNSISFANNSTGWVVGSGGLILKTTNGGVGVYQISTNIPEQFLLKQNYPNPFNPTTKINYEIKLAGFVSLKVFDLLGKEVATLVNEKQNAGSYAVDFNSAEYNLPSGIYFYTLNAGDFNETKKMVLIK